MFYTRRGGCCIISVLSCCLHTANCLAHQFCLDQQLEPAVANQLSLGSKLNEYTDDGGHIQQRNGEFRTTPDPSDWYIADLYRFCVLADKHQGNVLTAL